MELFSTVKTVLNIVHYHIAAIGWIITGDAIVQLHTIHERYMQRKYIQVQYVSK